MTEEAVPNPDRPAEVAPSDPGRSAPLEPDVSQPAGAYGLSSDTTGAGADKKAGPRNPDGTAGDDVMPVADAGEVGICCSGGGIRAAAYAIGCLQVLEDEGVLRGDQRARYISA